jgi:hypothetical protein
VSNRNEIKDDVVWEKDGEENSSSDYENVDSDHLT